MKTSLPLILVMLATACSASVEGDETNELLDAYSSSEAVLLDFEFDGAIATTSTWNAESSINDQLLYTIGHLNGDRSVGRLDAVELTNVKTTSTGITYHAKMPVSWGKKTQIPTSYEFMLPKSSDYGAFTTKYAHECVDFGAHDVDSGSMWYYYRPNASGCTLDANDIVRKTAKVTVSKLNTDGKYPEYDKIWEDGELDVVAVFGKYENGATTSSDAGISAYNQFNNAIAQMLRSKAKTVTTVPANVPPQPGVANADVQYNGVLADGRKINVNLLLVDEVSSAPQSFYTRYEGLSTKADVIMYNGHAGLGQNVRALSRHGKFVKGKYLIVFMDGCDTFAYVDGSLAEARATLNADDPSGSKYMEIVTNTMPAFFSSMPAASMALVNGLMNVAQPSTYQQMFQNVDSSQVIVVTGEEDNVFKPGSQPPPPGSWAGINESMTVAKSAEKKFTASQVEPGTYVFEINGSGDADLYVRVGAAPTTRTYSCRPFLSGSKERCEVSLSTKGDIGVMVRGWSTTSTVTLTGSKK